MNEEGWSLTVMLAFCTILLLGFFGAVAGAKKKFSQPSRNDVKLTNSIMNVIKAKKTKTVADKVAIDYYVYEKELQKSAINYYKKSKSTKKYVTLNKLVKLNYIKEIHDPADFYNICKGYVLNNKNYDVYLRCIGSYATDSYNLKYE